MIAFDLDDVVVDSESFTRDYILKKIGYDIGKDRSSYFIKIPDKPKEFSDELVSEVYSHIHQAKPTKNAITVLTNVYNLIKTDILFVTSRHTDFESNIKKNTEKWLKKHIQNKFPYSVIYSNKKRKSEVLPENIEFFVEDLPYFANDVSKVVNTVFLIDKGWNRNVFLRKNIVRIKSLDEAYRYLKITLKFHKEK